MKANAPEKIWIDSRSVFLNKPNKSGLTEYTRTDAFVEKVCEYMSYHLDTSKIDVNYKFDFIEEIRNYMKGE